MKPDDILRVFQESSPQDESPVKDGLKCPKCGVWSGDNWVQCEGECPMPHSPHYSALAAEHFVNLIESSARFSTVPPYKPRPMKKIH